MNVAFIPVWNPNPYHAELRAALEPQGVHVLYPDSLKSLHADVAAGREKLDVLHLHSFPYFGSTPVSAGRYLMFFRRLKSLTNRGIRVVWTVHDFQNHDSRYWRVEDFVCRNFARRLNATIVHGVTARRIVEDTWKDAAGKQVFVIPHGNYIRAYKNEINPVIARNSLGLQESDLVFLFLGLIRPYKGVEEMVQAFRACVGSNLRLIIAGRPVSEVMKHGVEKAIQGDARIKFFPENIQSDKIQVFMNASDVAVLPYRRVFTSGVAVLAMSFGKPCIAPRTGCVPDVLDEQGGVLFDPLVEGDLEQAFRKMISAKQRLPNMGQYNLDRAKGWDWPTIGRQTAAVYEQCLSNGALGGGDRG